MGTGQMLLATMALILLGMTIVNVNRTALQHGTILQQTEVGIYATSLATSIVEEAQGFAYDEATVEGSVTSTSGLTTTLGPEAGETTTPASTTNFDDFDDYNNLNMVLVVPGVDEFTVRASVVYINPTSPEVTAGGKTWHKRLDVSVWGWVSTDTVKTSFVFSYFNFR